MVRPVLLMLLLLAPFPVAAASCTYPAESATGESAIHFEQRWLDILQRHDTAALECILAPEFTDTSYKGVLRPREQVLHELGKRSSEYQQRLDDMNVQLHGNVAVVRGVNIITDQQNKPVARIRFTDVLEFSNGRWQAISAQETAQQ